MILELKNFNKLRDYLMTKNLKNVLSFYKIKDINDYINQLEIYCQKNNATIFILENQDCIEGYIIGIIAKKKETNTNIGTIINSMYDNINVLKQLVKQFELKAKSKNCEYLSIRVPEYQAEILDVLASNDYSFCKIELEKNLD